MILKPRHVLNGKYSVKTIFSKKFDSHKNSIESIQLNFF